MTIYEIKEKLGLKKLSDGPDRDIASCYISDLLSRVLYGCKAGDIWITVQTSVNMVAVAMMTDAACVILPEGLTVADNVNDRANEEGLSIYSSNDSAFTIAAKVAQLLN